MNIIVIDDNFEFSNKKKKKIEETFNAKVKLYEEYIPGIIDDSDDILFLDVMLGNKESFELGEQLLTRFPSLILVYMSHYDHFVYESFKQKTFYFLRKKEMEKDLESLYIKYNKLINNDEIEILVNKEKITLKHRDIIYVESKKNKIYIYTNYQRYETYMSLINLEKQLNSICFYRFNSYMLFNLNHIQNITNQYVQLSNGQRVSYTRNSKRKLILTYSRYKGGDL